MGRFSSALAAYSQAADLAPGIAGYRLREAELLFQNDRAHDADVMMRGIVRKNPNYAGNLRLPAPQGLFTGKKSFALHCVPSIIQTMYPLAAFGCSLMAGNAWPESDHLRHGLLRRCDICRGACCSSSSAVGKRARGASRGSFRQSIEVGRPMEEYGLYSAADALAACAVQCHGALSVHCIS